MEDIIKISSRNFTITPAIKKYIYEKLNHLKRFEKYIKDISIEITNNKGESNHITYEININVPKDLIRIEEKGNDLYAVIDSVDSKVKNKIEKVKDKLTSKDIISQKDLNIDEEKNESDSFDSNYPAQITKRVTYSDNRPLHEDEAIHQMEVLNHNFFLFKNIDTNKYSVVYKRDDDTYGLIEPETV